MDKLSVSIVIPAYNEEERIVPTLNKIYNYFDNNDFSYEIIIVDDGSSDNTIQKVKDSTSADRPVVILANGQNKGKGYSVKSGMLAARGEFVFFTDADLSTPIEEIEKCIPYFKEGYDVVIGSRGLPDSDIRVHQPWYREKMGKIFNLFVKTILMDGIMDTQCGFKGFKKDAVNIVFNRSIITGFSFDVEILYISKKHNLKIKEIPIRWENSILSKVSPVKHSIQMFTDLVGIRIKGVKGNYN